MCALRLPASYSNVFGRNGATWLYDERSGMVGWCNDVEAQGGAHDKLAQRIGMFNQNTGKPLTYNQLASLDFMWGGAFDRNGGIRLNSCINNKEYGEQQSRLQNWDDPFLNEYFASIDQDDRKAMRHEVDPEFQGIQGREPPPEKQIGQRVLQAMLGGKARQYNAGGGAPRSAPSTSHSTPQRANPHLTCPRCRKNICKFASANAAYGRQLPAWNCDKCGRSYPGSRPIICCSTVSTCDWGICEFCV